MEKRVREHLNRVTDIVAGEGYPEYRSWIVFAEIGQEPRKVDWKNVKYIGDGCVEIEGKPYKVKLVDPEDGEIVVGIEYEKSPSIVTKWGPYTQTWSFEDCLFV